MVCGMKRFFSTALLAISLVLSGCGSESETIVDGVLESESLFFTADGRLFVSGGNGVYESMWNCIRVGFFSVSWVVSTSR